jgi:polar amino acid transport system ATP-binding protein
MAFLEIKDIHKSYGLNNVLKGIDISLDQGNVLAIIGASGGGKTTLLRCINFLTLADKGSIEVNGAEIYRGGVKYTDKELRANRLHFGLVFQNYNLFPQYNILKNVYLAKNLRLKEQARDLFADQSLAKRRKWVKEQRAANIEEARALLAKVGLADKEKAYPCELSGGQSQRAAIARALALSPDVLCFDEPTSALDPQLTKEVLNVIRDLKAEGRTMVIVTHEMAFAKQSADKIVFVSGGVIVEQGDASMMDNPQTEELRKFLASEENV